jgi:hypothetical protein
MTAKKTAKHPEAATQAPPSSRLDMVISPGQTQGRMEAEATLSPVVANTFTAKEYAKDIFSGDVSLGDAIAVTREKVHKVQSGDMSAVEATLLAQAETLDAIFTGLAIRARKNIGGGHMGAGETYLRLALKAQSQCRTTLETLAEVKNPSRPTFVKQQNIAQNQQVNNGTPVDSWSSTPARAHEKNITPSNELIEASHGERLDFGATAAAGGTDSDMAAVGTVNGATKRRRKSHSS